MELRLSASNSATPIWRNCAQVNNTTGILRERKDLIQTTYDNEKIGRERKKNSSYKIWFASKFHGRK